MSKNTPWHRAYRRVTWGDTRPEWPPDWVPPQKRFDDKKLTQLLPPSPVLTVDQRRTIQQNLRDIAEDFLTVALSTPLGISLGPTDIPSSKRAVWVERHLFNPAKELLDALSNANAPMWSGWPDLLDVAGPDRATLIHELEALRNYARDLAWNLQSRSETTKAASRKCRLSSRGANHTQEFRLDLANALREVFERYYSGLTVSRGTELLP
jgi:hypothetical protein